MAWITRCLYIIIISLVFSALARLCISWQPGNRSPILFFFHSLLFTKTVESEIFAFFPPVLFNYLISCWICQLSLPASAPQSVRFTLMNWTDIATHLFLFLIQMPFSKELWISNSILLGRQILPVFLDQSCAFFPEMNAMEPSHLSLWSVPAAVEIKWLKQQQNKVGGKKNLPDFCQWA